MRLIIASDHRGFAFKNILVSELSKNFQVVDLGAHSAEKVDYPDFSHELAHRINIDDIGILVCGSGIGMSIAINRYDHIRGALCRTEQDSIAARKHNDANVIIFGSDITTSEKALEMMHNFIETRFEGGRHQTRLNKINKKGN